MKVSLHSTTSTYGSLEEEFYLKALTKVYGSYVFPQWQQQNEEKSEEEREGKERKCEGKVKG